MNRILLFCCLIFIGIEITAQVDRTFWFVAPEVTSGHDDNPVDYKITTGEKSAQVKISYPAKDNFSPIVINIAANTQRKFEVKVNDVENRPAYQVNDKGILFESNEDITVYYEVASVGNPDKFTLKGRNALGNHFFIPGQNYYANAHWLSPKATEKADIVATQDNTIITIIPKVNLVGHPAGIPFNVVLNKGETYGIENIDITESGTLAGTEISSDKPIGITISDDSVYDYTDGLSYDLIGDQIVPVDVLGLEYIAARTNFTSGSVQKVFVTAIANDTYVWLSSDFKNPTLLQKGETTSFDVENEGLYIKADKQIYAYFLTGVRTKKGGNECGSAILPRIACTGSREIVIKRALTKRFFLQLITRKGNVNNFELYKLDGLNEILKNDLLGDIVWHIVPGAEDPIDDSKSWCVSTIQLGWSKNLAGLDTKSTYKIKNKKGVFHASYLDATGGGMSYGVFSSFKNSKIIGNDQACKGDVITLKVEHDADDIKWYSTLDGDIVLGNTESLNVNRDGKYYVVTESLSENCILTDTINVKFTYPKIDLGEDRFECPNTNIDFSVESGGSKYVWNDGYDGKDRTVNLTENTNIDYSIVVTDTDGCTNTDTVHVETQSIPIITLPQNLNICKGDTLRNKSDAENFVWSVNDVEISNYNKPWIIATESGTYKLKAWNNNDCVAEKDIEVTVHDLPVVNMVDFPTCFGSEHLYQLQGYSKYSWHGETKVSNTSTYLAKHPEDVVVQVTDKNGCKANGVSTFSYYPQNAMIPLNNITICEGENFHTEAQSGYFDYMWYKGSGDTKEDLQINSATLDINNVIKDTHESIYTVEAVDKNGCPVTSSLHLYITKVMPLSILGDTEFCEGEEIILSSSLVSDSYEWVKSNNGKDDFISNNLTLNVKEGGLYKLSVKDKNKCYSKTEHNVIKIGKPTLNLNTVDKVCPNGSVELSVNTFVSFSGSNEIKKYNWSTGGSEKTISIDTPGNYQLTAFDDKGCSVTDEIDVALFDVPKINMKDDINKCSEATINLSLPNELNAQITDYRWIFDGNELKANQSVDVQLMGDYTLRITDLHSCLTDKIIHINNHAIPELNLGDDKAICKGDDIVLSVPATFMRYEWNGDPKDKYNVKRITSTSTEKLAVWDEHGCTATDEIVCTVYDLPIADLGDDRGVCFDTAKIVLSIDTSHDVFWNTKATSKEIKVGPGIYDVTLTDSHGCVNYDTITVNKYDTDEMIYLPDATICDGTPYSLDVNADYVKYEWKKETFNDVIDLPTTTNVYDFGDVDIKEDPAQYTIRAWDEHGCVAIRQMNLFVQEKLDVSLGADIEEMCTGEQLKIKTINDWSRYQWFEIISENNNDPKGELPYLEVNKPGTYKVIAQVNPQCENTDTIEITTKNSPILKFGKDDTICPSQLPYKLEPETSTAGDGATLTNYLWSTEETGEDLNKIDIDDEGTYSLTLTNSNGCTATDEIKIDLHPTLQISIEDELVCEGQNKTIDLPTDVKDIITIDNLMFDNKNVVGNYPYSISEKGTYTLNYQSKATGCLFREIFDLNYYEQEHIDLGQDTVVCIGQDFKLQVPDIYDNYKWGQFSTLNQSYININKNGTYDLTTHDQNNCVSKDVVQVTFRPLPKVSISGNLKICDGSSTDLKVVTDINNRIFWNDGATNSTINTGIGDYSVKVQDDIGCESEAKASVIKHVPINMPEIENQTVCEQTSFFIEAPENFTDYHWFFKGSNGEIDLNSTGRTLLLKNVSIEDNQGEYIVYAKNSNTCDVSSSMYLTIMSSQEIVLKDLHRYCVGEEAKIEILDIYKSYEWSDATGVISRENEVIVKKSGQYKVVVLVNDVCHSSASTNVEIIKNPTVTIAGADIICPGSDTELSLVNWSSHSGGGIENIVWSTGETTEKINVNIPNKYNVYAYDEFGCEAFVEKNIGLHQVESFNLPDRNICSGKTYNVDLPVHIVNPSSTYKWINSNGDIISKLSNADISIPGEYKIEVSDKNNCIATANFKVSQFISPSLNISNQFEACQNDTIELFIDQGFDQYIWNNDVNDNSRRKKVTKSGVQTILIYDKNSCAATKDINCIFNLSPTVKLSEDNIACTGKKVNVVATTNAVDYYWKDRGHIKEIVVPKGTYEFTAISDKGCKTVKSTTVKWYPIPSVSLGEDEMICPFDECILSIDKDYPIVKWNNGVLNESQIIARIDTINKVEVYDKHGCEGFDTKVVNILPEPEFNLIDSMKACSVDTILLDAGDGYVTYLWNDNSDKQTLKVVGNGTYDVQVDDGCHILKDTAQIIYWPSPQITHVDNTVTGLFVINTTGGTAPLRYKSNVIDWQDKNVIEVNETGEYQLTVEDEMGCQAVESSHMDFVINIDIPKIVTPNGDGYNDEFVIKGLEKFPRSTVKIYNRYGQLLHQYKGSDKAWDGTYLGKPVVSDSYWYWVKVVPGNRIFKGYITIKR